MEVSQGERDALVISTQVLFRIPLSLSFESRNLPPIEGLSLATKYLIASITRSNFPSGTVTSSPWHYPAQRALLSSPRGWGFTGANACDRGKVASRLDISDPYGAASLLNLRMTRCLCLAGVWLPAFTIPRAIPYLEPRLPPAHIDISRPLTAMSPPLPPPDAHTTLGISGTTP